MTTPEPATAETVTFHYTVGKEDLLDGVSQQYRVARKMWYHRWVPALAVLLGGFIALGLQAMNGRLNPGTFIALLVVIPLGMGYALFRARSSAVPRLGLRIGVEQIMRGNPQFADPIEVVLAPTGIRMRTSTAETTYSWAQYPFHTETDRVFALLASDRVAGLMLVLPKRGLVSPSEEAVRALLAQRTRRLG